MTRTKLMAALVLGVSGLACGTNGVEETTLTPDGLPLLTAEEQAVVDHMAKSTIAEIDLPEGRMKFLELSPGEISIMREIRMGAEVTNVAGERTMTLDQLFRAYAPAREVPRALLDAMARADELEKAVAQSSPQTVEPPLSGRGAPVEGRPPAVSPDGTERITSALASTVDQSWFANNFCRVSGVSFSWCFGVAWQGAYGSKNTHVSNTITCGDTGAARVHGWVDGKLIKVYDVPYGQCWTTGKYHHSHDWFGGSNRTTQTYAVAYAQASVRFAGYMVDGDGFYSAGY